MQAMYPLSGASLAGKGINETTLAQPQDFSYSLSLNRASGLDEHLATMAANATSPSPVLEEIKKLLVTKHEDPLSSDISNALA